MKKIQLLGMKKDLSKVLNLLQESGVMQVEEVTPSEEDEIVLEAIEKKEHDIDYVIANTDFAIKTLTPYAPKRPIWAGKPTLTIESALGTIKSFPYKTAILDIQKTEEQHVAAQNTLTALETEAALLQNWKALPFKLGTPRHTETSIILTGEVPLTEYDALKKNLADLGPLTSIDKIHTDETSDYIVLVFAKAYQDDAKPLLSKHKFQEAELPTGDATVQERLKEITEKHAELVAKIQTYEADYARMAKASFENLQIVHDVFTWQQEEQRVREKLRGTTYSFVVTGWIAKLNLKKFETALEELSPQTAIQSIKPEKGEETPIQLHNSRVSWPFESVTKLYGFPLINEVDPTPLLATFFIVFFALCLTDAGYGLLLFLIMFGMLKFFNLPKESTGLIKLLMWGGILTMIAGYFFGGYFGLTVEQAPAFMVEGDQFKGQIINAASGNGPLTFLVIALILGIIQILFGKIVDGIWKIKQSQYLDALLDSFLWVYFLLAIISFGLASSSIIIPNEYAKLTKWLVIGGAILMVLTQGRKQKGIAGKFGLGVLSLYGLVGYLSDILSYSRIMALGLATGIIAFAMNIIAQLAYDLIPFVGIVVAIIVLILGHLMNLVLSALGAFIHSARLQFVEFFSKFMEGGGNPFKPFKRTCKYIVIS